MTIEVRSYIKTKKAILSVALSTVLFVACGKSRKPSGDQLPEATRSEDASSSINFTEDCTTAERCNPLNMQIEFYNMVTGETVSSLEGMVGDRILWGMGPKVSVASTGDDITQNILYTNRLKLSVENLPSDASEKSENGMLVVTMQPQNVTSGIVVVKVRDIGRCELIQSQSGLSTEPCSDMSKNIKSGEIELTRNVTYSIRADPTGRKNQIIRDQINQDCKNQLMTSALSAIASGNILQTGIGIFTSQMACSQQKKSFEAQTNYE